MWKCGRGQLCERGVLLAYKQLSKGLAAMASAILEYMSTLAINDIDHC